MQKSRFSHSVFNVTSSFVKIIFVAVIGFVATPIIVKHIGEENFGHYRLLSDWMAFIGLAEFGIGGGVLVLFSQYARQKERLKNLLQTVFGVYLRILPIYLVAALIIFAIVMGITKSEIQSDFSISFWIMCSAYLFIPFTAYRAYLEATQRTSIVNLLSTWQMTLLNVAAIVFAYAGFGLIGQSFALFLSISSFYVLMALAGIKEYGAGVWRVWRDQEAEKKIWSVGRDNFYITSAINVGMMADTAIITWFFSPQAVVPFFVSQRLGNLIIQKIQASGVSLWASLADLWHHDQPEKFQQMLLTSFKVMSIFSFAVLLSLVVVNEDFVTLWMGQKNALGTEFILALAIFAWVSGINILWRHVLAATGHLKAQIKPYLLTGLCNLVLTIGLTALIGLSGPLWGSAGAMTMLLLWKMFFIKRTYSIAVSSWFTRALPGLGLAAILYYANSFVDLPLSWLNVFIRFGAVTAIYMVIAYFILFNTSERDIGFSRLNRLLRSLLKKS